MTVRSIWLGIHVISGSLDPTSLCVAHIFLHLFPLFIGCFTLVLTCLHSFCSSTDSPIFGFFNLCVNNKAMDSPMALSFLLLISSLLSLQAIAEGECCLLHSNLFLQLCSFCDFSWIYACFSRDLLFFLLLLWMFELFFVLWVWWMWVCWSSFLYLCETWWTQKKIRQKEERESTTLLKCHKSGCCSVINGLWIMNIYCTQSNHLELLSLCCDTMVVRF